MLNTRDREEVGIVNFKSSKKKNNGIANIYSLLLACMAERFVAIDFYRVRRSASGGSLWALSIFSIVIFLFCCWFTLWPPFLNTGGFVDYVLKALRDLKRLTTVLKGFFKRSEVAAVPAHVRGTSTAHRAAFGQCVRATQPDARTHPVTVRKMRFAFLENRPLY